MAPGRCRDRDDGNQGGPPDGRAQGTTRGRSHRLATGRASAQPTGTESIPSLRAAGPYACFPWLSRTLARFHSPVSDLQVYAEVRRPRALFARA